jgi:DNA-binding CsgD family transcriptional regulator
MATRTASGVVGRERELAALTSFLGDGGPVALALEGEAGVGKTTLWLAGVEEAEQRGRRVLQSRPAEAESRLAFAGLGDLLEDVPEETITQLPALQAEALRVALLLERAGAAPRDERTLGVALLGLLRRLAEDGPLLLAVDDVQWLDAATARALAFAWRRLRSEPVALLVAHRAGSRAPPGLDVGRRLAVGPMSIGAVHRLLHARLGLVLPRPALRRVHEASRGNPFYALELGRGAQPETGEPPPVPEQLRDLVLVRLDALPAATTDALAVTAALARPTLGLLAGAGAGEEALRPALAGRVLELDGERIRFAHPLLAAGAYERLDELSRRALHRRLADLVDDEERWRHLALAATGPDAAVADGLERSAVAARRRGASSSAAELCELAERLTPPGQREDVHRRTLAAGFHRWVAGDTVGACARFAAAADAAPGGRLRAEAMAAHARALTFVGDQREAVRVARRALAEPGAGDAVRAEAAQAVCWASIFLREELEDGEAHADLAATLAERVGDDALAANARGVQAILQGVLGRPQASATFARAIAVGDVADPVRRLRSPRFDHAVYLMWTDALDESAAILRDVHAQAVRDEDEGSLPLILAQRALAAHLAGRWREAAALAEESHELALQTGERPQQALALSARALVRASEGRDADCRADADAALAIAGTHGMAAGRIHALWALALLDASLDRPMDVAERLGPERERLLAAGVAEPGSMRFVGEEVEALVRLGRLDDAEAVLAWLDERARSLDRPSARATAWRCRGLLAAARHDPPQALTALDRALEQHARVPMPFERARTLLSLGEVQLRAGRRRDARATLEQASAAFGALGALGARAWRAAAETELGRIGGRRDSGDALTPAERRVADLVARGGTNKQVAAALYLSSKTVEAHLRSIFRKLDVHTRAELTRRLLDEQS